MLSALPHLTLSIVSLFGPVNAEAAEALAANTPQPTLTEKLDKKARSQGMSLEALVRKILNEGEDDSFGKFIGNFLGVPDGAPIKLKQVAREKSADNRNRSCAVVGQEPAGHGFKPVCLVFLAQSLNGLDGESHYFRVAPDGSLETSFISRMKFDESGKPVRGSGVKTDLDVNAPETKALLQHELDFWLKGKYRKKPTAAKTAPASASAGGSR